MTLLGRLPSGQRSSTRRCWLAESTTCPTWSLWDLERVCFTCEFLPACAGCVCIWEPWVMPAPTPWMLPETECRTRTTAQTSQHPLSSVCSKGWFAFQSLAEHRGVVLAAPLWSTDLCGKALNTVLSSLLSVKITALREWVAVVFWNFFR